MPNNRPCVVSALPDDIREQVETQFARGISAPSISSWLVTQGFKVTPRQLYNYKDKLATSRATPITPVAPIYSLDATDSDMLRSLLKTTLDAVNRLEEQSVFTGDLRTTRVLREMIETAAGLLKFRLTNEQPEPQVEVNIVLKNLEDDLGAEKI